MNQGPRGSRLWIDPSPGTPLVWFQIAVRGGSAADPIGHEGFVHHLFELARRGAGERDRVALDQALDQLGATLEVEVDRDAVSLRGSCLGRNLDPLIELCADILARPRFDPDEHALLRAETLAGLDDLRDDDRALAARFFAHHCVPGHPYARTVLGNQDTLPRLELADLGPSYRSALVPGNLIIGFAGAISAARAESAAARLVAELPDRAPPPLPKVDGFAAPAGRRLVLVDKPERSQSQVVIGHLGPRYGSDDAVALTVAETVLGGTFSSRLMQAIRVERGWSYGAGCHLDQARGPHWFRIFLAPSIEVTADAARLAMTLFEQLVADGCTADELGFARSYLAGSMRFRLATPRQRLGLAVQREICGLDDDFHDRLPDRLATVGEADIAAATRRWLHPDAALTVVVTSADQIESRLADAGLGPVEVVAFDSY